MDIKQLEAFVNVVNLKSFSAAAKALYLTQPTISAHILSLEQELNCKLIIRTTREVYPTKAGQVFFKYAEEILKIRQNAVTAVKNFETSKEGEIIISSSSVPFSFFLPKLIDSFKIKNPKVTFKINQTDSLSVIKDIENQDADIGFTGTEKLNSKCTFTPFTEDKLIIIAPNTLYYRTKFADGYSIQRLSKEPFICRKKGSGTRKEAEYLLKEAGVDIDKIHIISEHENDKEIIDEVSRGGGVAVISNLSAEATDLKSKIITFTFENITRSRKFYIVRHNLTSLSNVSEDFYNFTLKFFQNTTKFLY